VFSWKKVAICVGHEVLMEVDYNNLHIVVADPQGTLGQQLRLRPIHSLNIVIIILNISYIIYF
jgi:hypothetical protein